MVTTAITSGPHKLGMGELVPIRVALSACVHVAHRGVQRWNQAAG